MALPLLRLMGRERTANALLALIMMLLWCEKRLCASCFAASTAT